MLLLLFLLLGVAYAEFKPAVLSWEENTRSSLHENSNLINTRKSVERRFPPHFWEPWWALRTKYSDSQDFVTVNGKLGGQVHCPPVSGDRKDCSKYYICQSGVFIQQNCPSGLRFNEELLKCDWPENTKCEDGLDNELEVVLDLNYKFLRPRPFRKINQSPNNGFKIVCYFTNWAWYRQDPGKFLPENIDPNLCTHVIYAFTVLDPVSLEMKSFDPWADIDNSFFTKISSLSSKGIKVLLGLGGWTDSAGDQYSRMVNDANSRKHFIERAISFIEKYQFQGLDLDWEYPRCWQGDCTRGPESDKAGFTALVNELSEEFKKRGWLLSAAVSPSQRIIDQAYDVPAIAKSLDWISIMAYDYHGSWDGKTGHIAPLYYKGGDIDATFNANFTVNYLIAKGSPPNKLVLGMPMYGHSFTLSNPAENELNAPTNGPGEAGEFTKSPGTLAFYEICRKLAEGGWVIINDPEGRMGPYAYKGNQWFSYDDDNSIKIKSEYIKKNQLGGGMIWALDFDDFKNTCGFGNYPLLKTINNILKN